MVSGCFFFHSKIAMRVFLKTTVEKYYPGRNKKKKIIEKDTKLQAREKKVNGEEKLLNLFSMQEYYLFRFYFFFIRHMGSPVHYMLLNTELHRKLPMTSKPSQKEKKKKKSNNNNNITSTLHLKK